ncbi:hypothetical protein ACMD2_15287 [Ananas comosus]|uniref:Uncharacterized protein n=1 Tax=Ananas comosus TaxID=4615 RepID=A0A199UKF6_ANACO|nr:hypothetical protein ACMD2_15287 [Ananas comosus]
MHSDSASSALVASSRSRIFGFLRTALAMAIRCFWPPESCTPPPTLLNKIKKTHLYGIAMRKRMFVVAFLWNDCHVAHVDDKVSPFFDRLDIITVYVPPATTISGTTAKGVAKLNNRSHSNAPVEKLGLSNTLVKTQNKSVTFETSEASLWGCVEREPKESIKRPKSMKKMGNAAPWTHDPMPPSTINTQSARSAKAKRLVLDSLSSAPRVLDTSFSLFS